MKMSGASKGGVSTTLVKDMGAVLWEHCINSHTTAVSIKDDGKQWLRTIL
jgi:hypothetical protein